MLGANEEVPLLAPDGFTPFTEWKGRCGSDDGHVRHGRGLFGGRAEPGGRARDVHHGAQAGVQRRRASSRTRPMQRRPPRSLLDAIDAAGDDRAAIIASMIRLTSPDGILGAFALNEDGDVNTGAITVYEARNGAT